jgi:signal peptidase II
MPDVRARAYGLAGLVFALDRATKWAIETYVPSVDTYRIIPGFFDIVHSQNRGVAFGLFNDSNSEWRTFILIVLSGVALTLVGAMLWRARRMDKLTVTGLSLILGGATGNVFDRLIWGQVTDFLEFYIGSLHWPTFNVADSAIVVGSALLLLAMLRPNRQAAAT